MGTTNIRMLAAVAGLALWLLASGARAQEPAAPILLTVESEGGSVDAAEIREALADAIGLPVVSLLEADTRDAGRTINVAFEAQGRRARIRVDPAGLQPRWARVEASEEDPKDGTWVAPELARMLHEMRTAAGSASTDRLQGCLDVLDPWRNTVPGPALAPWDASRFAQATPIDDAGRDDARREERADGLTPPEPARR